MSTEKFDPRMLLIITTESDLVTAKKLGRSILQAKLAACINFSEVMSMYWWKNKLEETSEVQLLIKTRIEFESHLLQFIENKHSYSLPEMISIKGESGSKYIGWIENVLN